MTKERKRKYLAVHLEEVKANQKIAETSVKHIEAENGQLNQVVKDLKEETSLEKSALKAMWQGMQISKHRREKHHKKQWKPTRLLRNVAKRS